MPYGVVDWYDAGVGEGRILRSGRPYTVREADLDPRCRVPGMRVHFDVDREHGDTAVNVTERRGGARHRHRLGDRSGHRAVDQASGPASASEPPPLGRDLERRPGRVAEMWAALLGAGDLEHLTGLYAPHAVVRHAGRHAVGPGAIGAFWSRSDLLGVRPDSIDDHGDGTVLVRWPVGDDGVAPESRLTIAHGEIDDQWIGVGTRTTVRAGAGETTVSVSAVGAVRPEEWNAAVDEVESVLTTIDEPVLAARVRLERSTDPARERPCLASATIDVDGDPLRAHAAGADMIEAIHRLADRLRRRRHHVVDRRLALRHRGSGNAPGTWRHGDVPDVRAAVHPRAVADREIVRRKTFAPGEETVDEAILDLESLDHEFFLFTDLSTGQDAVVWRDTATATGPDGDVEHLVHGLRLLEGVPVGFEPRVSSPVRVERGPAPTLGVADARESLEAVDGSWLFFRDPADGRGRVLYRRYDGHYGLIAAV